MKKKKIPGRVHLHYGLKIEQIKENTFNNFDLDSIVGKNVIGK